MLMTRNCTWVSKYLPPRTSPLVTQQSERCVADTGQTIPEIGIGDCLIKPTHQACNLHGCQFWQLSHHAGTGEQDRPLRSLSSPEHRSIPEQPLSGGDRELIRAFVTSRLVNGNTLFSAAYMLTSATFRHLLKLVSRIATRTPKFQSITNVNTDPHWFTVVGITFWSWHTRHRLA